MKQKMRLIRRGGCWAMLGIALFIAAAATAQTGDKVAMTIADKPISLQEFKAIYEKNNKDSVITKKDLEDYLDLFINFKLKVQEAEDMGLDTSKAFKEELRGYRSQLAQPYLRDSELTQKLLHQAYDRMKTEVRASHILFKLPANPTPADTMKAWNSAQKVKKLIKQGGDFASLARKYSDDKSARKNGGDLGYFTALQMVYPFENAAYNTHAGEVTGPVRTRYGYHLVKVTDTRDARGQIRVAHIMVKVNEEAPEDAQTSAKKRINELYQRLQNGEDFTKLARKFSDDRKSAARGGELPAFGAGRMVESFENAAFALKSDGDISKPVRTPYGWHIIKRLEKLDLKDYDKMLPELKSKVSKDSRSQLSEESFVNKLKKKYHFEEYRENLDRVIQVVDTNLFNNDYTVPEDVDMNKPLFKVDGKTYTQRDFADELTDRYEGRSARKNSIKKFITDRFNQYEKSELIQHEDAQLEDEYPRFRRLVNEYHDGILLFDLTDTKVWTKAVKDSSGLEQFYENHRKDYMWKKRLAADIYTASGKKTAKKARRMLRKGKNADQVRKKLNESSALNVKVESGLFEQESRPVLQEVKWKKGTSKVVPAKNDKYKVLKVKEVRDPEPKALSEIRGVVTADYQDQLEKEWIKSLRHKYDYSVNRDVLYSLAETGD